ncbi:MAG: hypothetical protein M3Q07_27695 [Pseudobdellovibrionaceae bacterium]|nr:hypothetical protein [Pseudobdellovibrionaceae bacterium]
MDPHNLKFVDAHYQGLEIFSEQNADVLCMLEDEYGKLFRKHPNYVPRRDLLTVEELFADPRWQQALKL